MRFIRQLLLANFFLLAVMLLPAKAAAPDAAPAAVLVDAAPVVVDAAPLIVDAGVVDAAPAAAPATIAPIDPATVSLAELTAARRQGWAAVLFVLVLLAIRALPALLPAVPQLAFLEQGKNAVLVAALAAGCAAGYNAVTSGGAWTAIAFTALAAALAHIDFGVKPKA
jgi:hypothetical protein